MIGLDTNVLLRWLVDESVWPCENPAQIAAATALLGSRSENVYINDTDASESPGFRLPGTKG